MSDKYLKVIEILGEAIMNNELKISVLEYENKNLKEKIKAIENKLNSYRKDCEEVN